MAHVIRKEHPLTYIVLVLLIVIFSFTCYYHLQAAEPKKKTDLDNSEVYAPDLIRRAKNGSGDTKEFQTFLKVGKQSGVAEKIETYLQGLDSVERLVNPQNPRQKPMSSQNALLYTQEHYTKLSQAINNDSKLKIDYLTAVLKDKKIKLDADTKKKYQQALKDLQAGRPSTFGFKITGNSSRNTNRQSIRFSPVTDYTPPGQVKMFGE